MVIAPAARRAQSGELAVLVVLYLLQNINAEMLRRSAGNFGNLMGGSDAGQLVAGWSYLLAHRVHPVAMVVFGVWLATMAVLLGRKRLLPRWSFDGAGLWFSLRLLAEFLTINGLLFEGSKVETAVLLGQIVLYIPYFVLTWGWVFQRLDWVGQSEPGHVVKLSDADYSRGITQFDYYHSAVNTLLNRGNRDKATIVGTNHVGRLLVLGYLVMILALYAAVFTRILQLTKAVI